MRRPPRPAPTLRRIAFLGAPLSVAYFIASGKEGGASASKVVAPLSHLLSTPLFTPSVHTSLTPLFIAKVAPGDSSTTTAS